ncbi:hypothetical protein JCM5353_004572 [Sporobolomyces roseus]
MSAPRAYQPSSFPFFHLHPFTYSTLPDQFDQLTTQEIALAHLLLDNLDQATWRKLLRTWRARREKERGSSNADSTPSFALLDMSWPIPEDLGFLDSAQIAALPLHPDYKPAIEERARAVFRQRRDPSSVTSTSNLDSVATSEIISQSEDSTIQTGTEEAETVTVTSLASVPSADAVAKSASSHVDSDSPLPSTVPSSPAPPSPEPELIHVLPSSNVALRRWMTISKPTEKTGRTLAADSFEWEPEPPQPVPVQPLLVHTSRRSISPFYEESPSPEPNPEETARHATSFFDRLQFGTLDGIDNLSGPPQDSPMLEEASDVKPELKLEDRLAQPVTNAPEPSVGAGESLLQRISGGRPPSPAPSAVSTSTHPPPRKQAPPKGVVPRSLTRRWSTFLVHSIINKLPEEEIRELIAPGDLPEPVAIQIKRNPPGKRFCLVFVAYSTPGERDKAAAGLEGTSYGFQKLKLIIKQVEKPPEAYDWDWASTSEHFQEEFHRGQQRGPPPARDRSPKRRRISSTNSLQRSLSPLPPQDSYRPRSPDPHRRHSPPRQSSLRRDSPDRFTNRERSRSPPPRNALPPPLSRGRSRSPARRRASSPPPRSMTSLDRPVPLPIIQNLHCMILNNLPNHVTRQDVIDFFPPRSFVGLAINHPDDRRYVRVGAQRPIAHGSAFLLFETGAEREKFAQSYCSRKTFKGSPVPLWYDHKMKRIEEWLWWEMMEDWALKNGGPRPISPPPSRLRSRSPPPPRIRTASTRDFSPPPPRSRRESSNRPIDPPSDRYPRTRNYSFDEPRPSHGFPHPAPPLHDSYHRPPDSSARPSDHTYRDSESHHSSSQRPPFPPSIPPTSNSHYAAHARYHTAPQDHYRAPPLPPQSQQQDQRKRATWSEEPAVPPLPPVVPPPHFPAPQNFPAPYYSSTAPSNDPYRPDYPSNYVVPSPAPPPPVANQFDPQALRSSAAARYGYSQETEYRRG